MLDCHLICQLSGPGAEKAGLEPADGCATVNGGFPLQSRKAPGRSACIASTVDVACELRLKYLLKNKGLQLFLEKLVCLIVLILV